MSKDITLTVDYHDRACVVRWFDHSTRCDQGAGSARHLR